MRVRAERAAKKRPVAPATGRGDPRDLRELDPVRPRPFLARLDLERNSLAAGERVEVDARVETGAVEEVLLAVLRRDEAEPTVGDELLDGPCRHRRNPPSRKQAANARVLREE